MSRPLTELELRWIVPRIRSARRSLRIGWTVARWVFLSGALIFILSIIPLCMDGQPWWKLLGAVALGVFMGLIGLFMPKGGDGERDPQESDPLEANWIRATPDVLVVGSGKSTGVIRTMAGAKLVAPSGWLADLPDGVEAEVEMVSAFTPDLHAGVNACIWPVAIRGKRSLRAELEAGCTDDPALAASLWCWGGGILLGVCLAVLLATGGFPRHELSMVPAVCFPRARAPVTGGWIPPGTAPRPGDRIELGAYFTMDEQRDPDVGVPLMPWRPSQRDSFLLTVQTIRERMARASMAADSASHVLWAFRPAFHNVDMLGLYDGKSAKVFRREWSMRKSERKLWLARMDTLLPGDSAWAGFLGEVRQRFASVDASGGDPEQGRAAAAALHQEVLRLLHRDSSQSLLLSENAILSGMWERSVQRVLGTPLASGIRLEAGNTPPYPIPCEFHPGERWLQHPELFDSALVMLDSLPLAFRPAGAHAVWSHFEYVWTVVRLGEPPTLRDLLLSLKYWTVFFAAVAIWLSVGTWKIIAWRRTSAIAKAASAAWWTDHPEG